MHVVNEDAWLAACEDGYEAIAQAFNHEYDHIGHFELLVMSVTGPVWIASGYKGAETYYATVTVRKST